MVDPAAALHATVPIASMAATGIAASSPPRAEIAAGSKRAASRTAVVSDPRGGAEPL
jgi:hypothetical protein